MKKRLISAILAILLLFSALSLTVSASGSILYSSEDIEELYYEFEFLSGMFEPMFGTPEGIAYWQYAVENEESIMGGLIDASVALLGETPDEE